MIFILRKKLICWFQPGQYLAAKIGDKDEVNEKTYNK